MKHLTFFILFLFVYCPATAQVAVLDGTDDPLGIYLESFTLGSELEGPNIGQRYRYHLITNEGYRYLLTPMVNVASVIIQNPRDVGFEVAEKAG